MTISTVSPTSISSIGGGGSSPSIRNFPKTQPAAVWVWIRYQTSSPTTCGPARTSASVPSATLAIVGAEREGELRMLMVVLVWTSTLSPGWKTTGGGGGASISSSVVSMAQPVPRAVTSWYQVWPLPVCGPPITSATVPVGSWAMIAAEVLGVARRLTPWLSVTSTVSPMSKVGSGSGPGLGSIERY